VSITWWVQRQVSDGHFNSLADWKGHQKVAGDGQVPGTLVFCEIQSVRQSSNFAAPASTSVTHAVSPADSLRGQSTYQHEEPSWRPNRGAALPHGSLAGDHPWAMAFSDTVASTMTRCKSAFFSAAMASAVSIVVFKSAFTPASPIQTQIKHLGNTTSRRSRAGGLLSRTNRTCASTVYGWWRTTNPVPHR
jgi:hypothetical protein